MTPSPLPSAATTAVAAGATSDGWLAFFGTIAAAIAVHGYRTQQQQRSKSVRADVYSEALRAIDDYLEAPHRVRRRDGTAAARITVTNHISDVQSRLAYYQHLLVIHSPGPIAAAYKEAVCLAKTEAGPQMTAAWNGRPTRRDRDVPLVAPYKHAATNAAMLTLTALMSADAGDAEPTR